MAADAGPKQLPKSQDRAEELRVLRFLGLFARLDDESGYLHDLAEEAQKISASPISWDHVIRTAEVQGIAPLLYYRLKHNPAGIPAASMRMLKGLYLRHRLLWEVRTSVLGEIVAGCEERGIAVTLLKGAALAHLLYPEPGLRPSSDIDLLVPEAHIPAACDLLGSMGFHLPPVTSPKAYLQKHLPQATLSREGETVRVDLHHHLLKQGRPNRIDVAGSSVPPLEFSLGAGGSAARTLNLEDTLRYLCLHFCDIGHEPLSPVSGNTRLIWAADITGFAGRYAGDVDWERIGRLYPFVIGTLALLSFLTPLPGALEPVVPIRSSARPAGVGEGYRGWPGAPLARHGLKGSVPMLKETFFPTEWWLRLYYGLGTGRSVYYHRWLGHPLHILTHVGRLVRRRLGAAPG